MTLWSRVLAVYLFCPEGRQPETYQQENISWKSAFMLEAKEA